MFSCIFNQCILKGSKIDFTSGFLQFFFQYLELNREIKCVSSNTEMHYFLLKCVSYMILILTSLLCSFFFPLVLFQILDFYMFLHFLTFVHFYYFVGYLSGGCLKLAKQECLGRCLCANHNYIMQAVASFFAHLSMLLCQAKNFLFNYLMDEANKLDFI